MCAEAKQPVSQKNSYDRQNQTAAALETIPYNVSRENSTLRYPADVCALGNCRCLHEVHAQRNRRLLDAFSTYRYVKLEFPQICMQYRRHPRIHFHCRARHGVRMTSFTDSNPQQFQDLRTTSCLRNTTVVRLLGDLNLTAQYIRLVLLFKWINQIGLLLNFFHKAISHLAI